MTVFSLLADAAADPQEAELRSQLAQLKPRFPGAAPADYTGRTGRELETATSHLIEIDRLDRDVEATRAQLPALQADAALQTKQSRGRWLLLGLVLGIVALVLLGMVLL